MDEILDDLYPPFSGVIKTVLRRMVQLGSPMRITRGLVSFSEQREVYLIGRGAPEVFYSDKPKTPNKVVTYSKPGFSNHHWGIAVDCCFMGKDPFLEHDFESFKKWSNFGRVSKEEGCAWGGDWSRVVDKPHVERLHGFTLTSLRQMFEKGGLCLIWSQFDKALGINGTWEASKVDALSKRVGEIL